MRSFPRTARSRMAAATAAAAIALGTRLRPDRVRRRHLKDRQKQVERKIDRAHDQLDESSKQLRRASDRLEAARGQLADARTALATARGRLAVAQERDAAAAVALEQAEATLARRQAELAAGEAARGSDQRDVVGEHRHAASTPRATPHLMAFASLLDSESAAGPQPAAPTSDQAMVDKQARDYDRLQAAEVLLEVHENQVEEARDDVAVKREQAADNLAETQQLEVEAEAAKASVRGAGRESARRPARRRRRSAPATYASSSRREREKARIEERLRRIAARALAAPGPGPPPTAGSAPRRPAADAGRRRRHLAVRLPDAPDLRLLGPARRHRLRRRLRPAPIVAAESGTVISSYWSDGLRQPADHQPRRPQRQPASRPSTTTRRRYTVGTGAHVAARRGHRLRRRHRLVHRPATCTSR